MKIQAMATTILTAAIVGFASGTASAYDLLDAYHDSLAADAELRSAQAALDAARERMPQARAGLLPQIGASAEVLRNRVDTNISSARSYTSQIYGVQLTQPLFRPQNTIAYEQSKLQYEIASRRFDSARQDLMLRVSEAYFDLLAARDNLHTIQAQKRAISEQLAAAKRNFEVGTATITDQQEAQARFDLATADEIAAQSNLDIRRAALELLTARPVGETDVLRQGVDLLAPEPNQESAWTEAARANALEVQQAAIGADVFRREIDRRRSAAAPTLDLVGQLGHARNNVPTMPDLRSDNAAVGVQLAIPLYTGGAITAGVREAAASLAEAEADVEVARRGVEQLSRQAFLGVHSGLAQVRALEAAEKSSELALASNELGYQVGVRINIDVLNAQQQLFTTRRDLLGARYQVLMNGLRLKASTATLDEGALSQVNALLAAPPATRSNADMPANIQSSSEGKRRPSISALTPQPAPAH